MVRIIVGISVLALMFGLLPPAQAQPIVKQPILVNAGDTVEAGQTFGYRLTYTCSNASEPCLDAEVIDLLPAEVQLVSTTPASPTGDIAAIQTTANFGGSGRTQVRFQLITPLPAGSSGNLDINVRFPNGSTPNGTTASNTVDAINLGASPGTFTSPPVTVTAVANPYVDLTKNLQTAPANLDQSETYRLRIAVPDTNGALDLTSVGPVTDTLPPGTVFNDATPAADCQPGCVGTTPATITWSAPCSVPIQPGQTCDIAVDVTFPTATFPSGTPVTNSFTTSVTPRGEPAQEFGPATATHPVTTLVPAPDVSISKDLLNGTPNPPTLNQTFSYEMDVSNSGNVPLDNVVIYDRLPVEFRVLSVTTGAYTGVANFAVGEGVRVSYEKNTAPGVFTLWGSSPSGAVNTTLTSPPPGLGAGEYITSIRWEFGQAHPGMAPASASARPRITGQIINPDNAGGPTAIGDLIQNCAELWADYTASSTSITRTACAQFNVSGPFIQLNPVKENLSGSGPFTPGQEVTWRLQANNAVQSSEPVPLENLVVTELLPANIDLISWDFSDEGTGLPAPGLYSIVEDFGGTGRTYIRWEWLDGSGNLGVGQRISFNITASVKNSAPSGSITNEMTVSHDASGLSQRCSGTALLDVLDLDLDANTIDTLCSASDTITILGESTAPITTASATANGAAYTFGDWSPFEVEVTLAASDGDGTGVAATYYAIDDATCDDPLDAGCIPYTAPFTISAEGQYTVTFFSVDTNDNVESVQRVAVNIDQTAPVTTASAIADGGTYTFGDWSRFDVEVTLSATDAGGPGVDATLYAIDDPTCNDQFDDSCTPYTGPFAVTTDGQHTVTFFSVDTTGNVEALQNVSINVDKTAPRLNLPANITANPTGPSGTEITFDVGATDNIDPSPVVTCNHPSGSLFPVGTTTVTCTATDHVGNQASGSFTISISSVGDLFATLRAQISSARTDTTQKNQMLTRVAITEILVNAGQPQMACLQLHAFDLYIHSQVVRRRIPQQDANLLYTRTAEIRAGLGCGSSR